MSPLWSWLSIVGTMVFAWLIVMGLVYWTKLKTERKKEGS